VGPELNAELLQGLLERHPEKFSTTVCLDPLDRKRKLFDHAMLQEVDRLIGGTPGVQAKHTQTGAIIDGGILEAAGDDFHRIDLNAIHRQWATVPLWTLHRSPAYQYGSLMGIKDFPDRRSGQVKVMLAQ
jgi:hypothetical protein